MNIIDFIKKCGRHSVGLWRRCTNPMIFELSKLVPDQIYLCHRYKCLMGKKLNLDPPVTYN